MSAILFFDILSIQVTIVLAIILVARRPPEIFLPWLLLVCLGAAIWSVAETAIQFYVVDPYVYSVWVLLLYTGLLLLVAGWLPFVLSFAAYVRLPFRFDTPYLRVVLKVVPCILLIAVVTNPLHAQFITPVVNERNIYGPLWYLLSTYSYLCLFASILMLLSLVLKLDKQEYKVQAMVVMAGCVLPLVLNIGYIARLLPTEADLTVVGIAFSSLMFVSAIYRYRLFALSPFTFHRLLESEIDPYLVLDAAGNVVAYSKLAEVFFGQALYLDCDGIDLVRKKFDVVDKSDRRDEFSIYSITRVKSMEFEAKTWREEDRCYHSISTNMVQNRRGTVLGIGVRFRDMTTVMQRTGLIEQQATILEGILEATNDAILVVNAKGHVEYSNKAMNELWPFDESFRIEDLTIQGKKFVDESLVNPDEFRARMHQLYFSDEVEVNHRVDLVDGRSLMRFSKPFASSVNEGIKDKGRIWVYHDITSHLQNEREKADLEKRTRDAERLESLGIMAGGVVHDFNNLLTIVMGRVDNIMASIDPQSQHIEDIQAIEAAGTQALGLTGQILSYTGDSEMQLRRLRFSDLVDQAMIVLQNDLSPKLNLEVDVSTNHWVMGDGSQLRQVLMNIIQNGAEAIGDNWGNLRVKVSRESQIPWLEPPVSGDYLLIQISDDGEGIDGDMVEKIFDPFVSTKRDGRGLGLAAVQGIVKGHEGHLLAKSVRGSGTTFWLGLPAVD